MKLLEYKEHEEKNRRLGFFISIIVSLIAWALIIFVVITIWQYITPFSETKKVRQAVAVEETPRLVINTEPVVEKQYLNIPLSHELQDYVKETVRTIKPELVFAVMEKESSFDNNKIGQANEVGFMQIHPSNFGWLASDWRLTDLHDPYQNIKAGIILLEYLTERESDIEMGLMYYNMKPQAAEKLFSQGVFHSKYSMEVVKRQKQMEGTE